MKTSARSTTISLILTVIALTAPAQTVKDPPSPKRLAVSPIRKVFLNVTGEQKLTRRLWAYLEFELEDVGVALATTERDADAAISVQLKSEEHSSHLGTGLIQLQMSAKGQTKNVDLCASTSTAPDDDLFSGSAGTAAEELKQTFPDARSVFFDPASDFKELPKFKTLLSTELRSAGIDTSEAPSDISTRVTLVRLKPEIKQTILKYEFSILSREGALIQSGNGNDIRSASLITATKCQSARNLNWMVHDDTLFRIAKQSAKAINLRNTGEKDPDIPDVSDINMSE